MKKIAKEFEDLLVESSALKTGAEADGETGEGTFRIYKDRSYFGVKLLNDLIAKRDGDYKKGDHVYHGFYLNDRNKDVGLLSQLYGASGLFTLVNRYNVMSAIKKDTEQADRLLRGIKSAIYDVLDYVEENGYDLNPYIDQRTNIHLFHDGRNCENMYIGAMTWALSLFVSALKALRTNSIDFRRNAEDRDEEIKNFKLRLYVQIEKIITFFLENVIEGEDRFGWGYANGCIDPSLFFTYSVIEAYSDFEDNAISDRDDELLAYLNRNNSKTDIPLEIRYRDLCYRIGDRTWEVYKDYLKTTFFSDKFAGGVTPISPAEIRNTSRSSVLFNTIYVIFILFYSYTNTRTQRYDLPGEVRSEAELEQIIGTITRGLQLVQNFYDDLKAEGNENIVDKHIISFNQRNVLVPEFSKMLNDESIQASSLLPMLVKANNLVAYYILKFPQQSMTDLFDEALSVKVEGKWLWENRRFDLLSTERYIEALADYFDYYDTYERNYAKKILDSATIRAEERRKLQKQNEERLKHEDAERQKRFEQKMGEARIEIRKEIERDIRNEYTIEPQIEQKIVRMIDANMERVFRTYIVESVEHISGDEELNSFESDFKSALSGLMRSGFAETLNEVEEDKELTSREKKEKFEKELMLDFKDFIKNYFDFVAKNLSQYERRRLSDLIFGDNK